MPRRSPTAALSGTQLATQLRTLAGDRAYERGELYARDGRVGDIAEDGGHITASVNGELRYRSSLTILGSKVTFACTCPVGESGACCKHCVALGLQWLDQDARAGAPAKRASGSRASTKKGPASARPLTMKDVRAHLASLPTEQLVNIVMQQAMEDDRLRQRLLLEAAKATGGGVKLHTFRTAITNAIGTGGFIDYREASGYFSQIHDVVSSIEELVRPEPGAAIELVEHALTLMEQAIGHVDDSDGGASDVLGRLHELHLAACMRAHPDPESLAERLFEREMRSEWDIFHGAVLRYADVLGETGVAHYRALAEKEWRTFPALGPGQHVRAFGGKRFRIATIMEALARLTGDVDAIVAVKARDLTSAYSYLVIAELCQQARRRDDALEWAERGVAAFPDKTDPRLREFLATQYVRRKRGADAIALLWLNFADRPSLEDYVALHATAASARVWPAWRERAITEVRRRIVPPRASESARTRAWNAGDASLLVEILLWERNPAAAWTEATVSGCSEHLWMQLAQSRETSHPSDALRVYQTAVEQTLSHTNNGAYRDAVSQLRVIARVMKTATIPGGFDGYLAGLRTRHKAKRNFMKLLDGAKFRR